MFELEDIAYRLGVRWRSYICQFPRIYALWIGIRYPSIALGIKRTTDLVLEGYPRSGNSFATHAFMSAQSCFFLDIAHHSHNPARIIQAVKRSIPTLVLIRSPKDCVLSYCIYQPNLSFQLGLQQWIRFYTVIKAYKSGYVLATFDEVITDFGQIIIKINDRFNTDFDIFEHTEENVKRTFSCLDLKAKIFANVHKNNRLHNKKIADICPFPVETRAVKKEYLETRIQEDQVCGKLLRRAQQLYQWYVRENQRCRIE